MSENERPASARDWTPAERAAFEREHGIRAVGGGRAVPAGDYRSMTAAERAAWRKANGIHE